MASLFARRACAALPRGVLVRVPSRSALLTRSIHVSPIAQKKKSRTAAIEEDDLFADDLFSEDLVSDTSSVAPKSQAAPTTTTTTTTTSASSTTSTTETVSKPKWVRRRKAKLEPSTRQQRFEAHLAYITPRLGRTPEVANPRIRKRLLITLAQLAKTEEELTKVSNLLPGYHAAGLEVPEGYAEVFARRCQELTCPRLALDVFGNFPRYQLALTIPAGQYLVQSLAVHDPKQLPIALALFSAYKLPPLAEDLTTAAIVAGAFANVKSKSKKNTEKAPVLRALVEDLRAPIAQLLERTKQETEAAAQKASKAAAAATAAAYKQAKRQPDNQATRRTLSSAKRRARAMRATPPETAKKMNWVAWSLHRANKAYVSKAVAGGQPFVDPALVPAGNRAIARSVAKA
ncbi:hypothetical protein JR316_0010282 [Psilocybe cubensis]|uniref:Uncharacterized protein n=2 Tax=Psilocybe cubensis TaxID=181762 RepID=A0A8H7XSE0_PSICU|nr:hypothetical protein JR316_0010282 [Psilocybe cubensis]KAH9478045.1 hypothetical protein JR316_0010282 [Psilocybe cubensis]